MKVAVLGAGVVGSIVARDLAGSDSFDVCAYDMNDTQISALKQKGVKAKHADLSKKTSLQKAIQDADLVVGTLPGHMGYQTLGWIIETGTNLVDVSFMGENPLDLQDHCLKHGVSAVVDMGIAPGVSNFIAGRNVEEMEKVNSIRIYVGGLPVARTMPFQYKAPFSPIDVIEEYIRPARYLSGGKIITTPALSEVEHLEFKGIGTLEAFFTDGLRTLLHTLRVPDMIEKTMRYPGHAMVITLLKSAGFFREDLINTGEVSVRPIDVTNRILTDAWKLTPRDRDFTALLIKVSGILDGHPVTRTYRIIDYMDEEAGNLSMARTTGYPCAIVARLMAQGKIDSPGIIPPEILGKNKDIYDEVMNGLKQRGLVFEIETENQ